MPIPPDPPLREDINDDYAGHLQDHEVIHKILNDDLPDALAALAQEIYAVAGPGATGPSGPAGPTGPSGPSGIGAIAGTAHGPKNTRGVFADHSFDPATSAGFYVRDIIVQIHDAPDSEADPPYDQDTDAGYFFSNQYGFVGGDQGAYIGLQTSTRRFVWSVWESQTPSIAEDVMITGTRPDGLTVQASPFSGEGDGQSLIVHHGWEIGGIYRMRLYDAGDLSSDGEKWFRFYLARMESDLSTVIWELQVGRIKNAPGHGYLKNAVGSWLESYLGARARPEYFPYMRVEWLRVEGDPLDGHHRPTSIAINWPGGDSWPITNIQEGYGKIAIETGILSL